MCVCWEGGGLVIVAKVVVAAAVVVVVVAAGLPQLKSHIRQRPHAQACV